MKKYFYVCPKTGRITGLKSFNRLSKFFLPFIGLAAMLWILIRVLPKPSRLSYPCVQTAMPIASGFIGYLVMLALSAVVFFKSKKPIQYFPVFFLGAFIVFGLSGFILFDTNVLQKEVELTVDAVVNANEPIGVAKGIFPGRVVWVHNPNATNKNCNPSAKDHGWFMPENNNQSAIDSMVSIALDSLTGQTSDSAAWRAIFQYHNKTRGKGEVNYVPGEKIFIKINATSGWGGNFNTSDLSKTYNNYYGISETSPAVVLAVLRQLVNVVGVAQSDIYIGDPMKHIYKHMYDQWYPEFPNVHYLDNNYSTLGREKVTVSTTAKIYYADHGTILKDQVWDAFRLGTTPWYNDELYSILQDAEYMINIPMLKGHKRAGTTMFAKNHFGSQTADDASHLHNGLIAPREMEQGIDRPGYGLYRVQVDLMTHSLLGKKNLVYIMDALWSTNHELGAPLKWQMAPFNNSWSSSVFASLDNVAIESVGYDFLRSEYQTGGSVTAYVQMDGVDDYLHQAADSTNWPNGIKYDPDSIGVHVYSLGVHEHWNNAVEKKYTRNLSPTGTGIELIDVEQGTITGVASQESRPVQGFELCQNYPNPFNPSTTIAYSLPEKSSVAITIYNVQGRQIKSYTFSAQSAGYQKIIWNGKNDQGELISSGVYFYRISALSLGDGKTYTRSAKMLLLK